MKTALEVGYFFIPTIVSIAAFFLIKRLLKETKVSQASLALAVTFAFFVGYWLLPDWAPLVPKRHWHYLPYLGVLAALVRPWGPSNRFTVALGSVTLLCVAFLAARMLVPTWPRLQPVRLPYVLSLTMYLFVVGTLLHLLVDRVPNRVVLAQLALTAACVAAIIAAFVSLLYGYVAGVAAASLFGGWLTSLLIDRARPTAQALIPVYVILVGGIAFVGYVELSRPLTGLILVPAAPLLLWICEFGPLRHLQGLKATIAQTFFVVAGLIGAASMIAVRPA